MKKLNFTFFYFQHMALGHSKLDELLGNEEILREKQEIAMAKPKKLSIGPW
jgi:hypothetical protein